MGKRIEDLRKLDDSPIEHQVEALDAKRTRNDDDKDERDQPWYQFAQSIEDLLATGDYDWAFDTLDGIRDTVTQSKRVTDAQQRAVTNIASRGEYRRRSSRRYEGYR